MSLAGGRISSERHTRSAPSARIFASAGSPSRKRRERRTGRFLPPESALSEATASVGDEHFVSGEQLRRGKDGESALYRPGKASAARFGAVAQHFEGVPLPGRKIAFNGVFPASIAPFVPISAEGYAGNDADFYPDMSLYRTGEKGRVLTERQPLCIIAAVIGALQIGKAEGEFPFVRAVQNAAIIAHRRRDVFGAAHPAFDLEGRHPRLFQPEEGLTHA